VGGEHGHWDTGGEVETILRQAAVWAEVPKDLEHRVLDEALGRRRVRPRRTRWLLAAAAVVALSAGAGVFAWLSGDEPHASLAGTALAAGSSAEAEVRDTPSGVEIRLYVDGLPPAPEGSYYEAWVKGDRGSVAIGTFHLRDGSDDIVLWSGVDLDEYPKITVTLQREGAGPASSGRVVLAGEVPPELR
jgi:anti-sigma-K factor RskA